MLKGEEGGKEWEREGGELEPRGGGRSAVQLCFQEPGISLCLTDVDVHGRKSTRKKRKREKKRSEMKACQ